MGEGGDEIAVGIFLEALQGHGTAGGIPEPCKGFEIPTKMPLRIVFIRRGEDNAFMDNSIRIARDSRWGATPLSCKKRELLLYLRKIHVAGSHYQL